jgi:hypothetical protein
MRTFLKNVILFSCLVFIYLTFVFAFNFYNENHPKINKYNITFIGDSHTRYSIIPDSFKSSANYGLNFDPIYVQKWRLNILMNREKIDTAIISLGYHSFAENSEDIPSLDDGLIGKLLERFILINRIFLNDIKLGYLNYTKAFMSKIKKPTKEVGYLGTYVKIDTYWNGKDGYRNNQQFKSAKVSTKNYNEIFDIIQFCESRKMICFFHFPPTTNEYKKRIPKGVIASTDSFLNVLNSRGFFLPTIQMLPDSCFFDPDHLNYSGAKIYTHSLKQALYNKKKLQKTNF